VQNRVAQAEPKLPEEVRRLGISTTKSSPDLMMVVHLFSPDGRYNDIYVRNYGTLQVRDAIARLPGVGDVQVFGYRETMRCVSGWTQTRWQLGDSPLRM